MAHMNRPSEAASDRRPSRGSPRLLAMWLAGLLLLSLGIYLGHEESGSGLLVIGLVCGVALLLGAVATTWHVAVRLTRARLTEALREARQHAQLLAQLQPHWQWQTDAEHHLVRWQAPQVAPSSSWVGMAATQSLWERFALVDSGPGASLQERLDQHLPLHDVLVQACAGEAGGTPARWLLRAQVCLDASGRFAGYLGTAAPLSDKPGAEPSAAPAAVPVSAPAATQPWLQAMPGPAWLLSTPTDGHGHGVKLLDLNDVAAQLMARPAAQLLGLNWGACQDALPAEIREALAQPGAHSGVACGHWWLCTSALRLEGTGPAQLLSLWPQGAPDSVPAALALDAAEVARADQESFSYTVSHDLRAPLRVVEGFARILKEDYGRLLDRIGNDHIDRVMGAATRMNSMIDALLSLSQLSSRPLQREGINLSQMANLVLDELKRANPERAIECYVQPGMQVQGDPTLLRMVLENLLGNAWKYSGKRELAQIRFETRLEQGERIFMVADNGAGFDMRFADRLFEVFQRLHSASDFQGTGVGLASVRRIVRRHGGDIWAESEVGGGARFFFTLS